MFIPARPSASGISYAVTVTSKTGSYPITTADNVIVWNTSGGAATATLPTAVGNSNYYYIILATAGNPLTINTTSAQTIGGIASGALKLANVNDSLTVISDGTNWQIVDLVADFYILAHVSSNQALTAPARVNFDTVDVDTYGLVTTGASAWVYTAPVAGVYKISSYLNSTSGGGYFYVYKNSSIFCSILFNAVGASGVGNGTVDIKLAATDTLSIRSTVTTTVSGGSLATTAGSYITITRIGN